MSLLSPAWPQQDEPSPCGTTTGLPPASSDSDSGCALEEYLEPSADPAPPEVGSTRLSPSPAWFPQQSTPFPGVKHAFQQLQAKHSFIPPVSPQVPPCFGPRSPQPGSPSDRARLRARALLQQLPPQDCDVRPPFLGCCPLPGLAPCPPDPRAPAGAVLPRPRRGGAAPAPSLQRPPQTGGPGPGAGVSRAGSLPWLSLQEGEVAPPAPIFWRGAVPKSQPGPKPRVPVPCSAAGG